MPWPIQFRENAIETLIDYCGNCEEIGIPMEELDSDKRDLILEIIDRSDLIHHFLRWIYERDEDGPTKGGEKGT